MDIQLLRDNSNNIQVNIPHAVHRHSELFDWGNMSPASLELALNIMNYYCDELTRERLYRKFAEDIITDIPYGGTILSKENIEAWISANVHYDLERKKMNYIVAVFKEENAENLIHFVQAHNEVEAIVCACDHNLNESEINGIVNQFNNDYNEVVEYYQSKGIYFSEPHFNER